MWVLEAFPLDMGWAHLSDGLVVGGDGVGTERKRKGRKSKVGFNYSYNMHMCDLRITSKKDQRKLIHSVFDACDL